MENEKILDISWKTLLKVFVLIVCIYIIYQIKDVLVWFIFAIIISILAEPSIKFLNKLKIPRALSVVLVYLSILGFIVLIVFLTAPSFIHEVQQFSNLLPQYFTQISPYLEGIGIQAIEDIEGFISFTKTNLEKATANIINILSSVFGGLFASIFILAVAIFLSLEDKGIEKALVVFFPKKYDDYLLSLWKRVQKRVTGWFISRVISCIFVGLATYITLLVFNAPYALLFGLLAGVSNFIVTIGPAITGIFIFIVVATAAGLLKAFFVLLAFAIIHQIESGVLIPLLSKKFIGLSPVLVLVSLVVGGILWGFLGAILAVPLAAILVEFLGDFIKKRREEEQDESVIL